MIQTIAELKAWFRDSKVPHPEFFVSTKLRREWLLEHETLIMGGQMRQLKFTNQGGGVWLVQLVNSSEPEK